MFSKLESLTVTVTGMLNLIICQILAPKMHLKSICVYNIYYTTIKRSF